MNLFFFYFVYISFNLTILLPLFILFSDICIAKQKEIGRQIKKDTFKNILSEFYQEKRAKVNILFSIHPFYPHLDQFLFPFFFSLFFFLNDLLIFFLTYLHEVLLKKKRKEKKNRGLRLSAFIFYISGVFSNSSVTYFFSLFPSFLFFRLGCGNVCQRRQRPKTFRGV